MNPLNRATSEDGIDGDTLLSTLPEANRSLLHSLASLNMSEAEIAQIYLSSFSPAASPHAGLAVSSKELATQHASVSPESSSPSLLPTNKFSKPLPPSPEPGISASFLCWEPGCIAPSFKTQRLLYAHLNGHAPAGPYYCPVNHCERGEGGRGFSIITEMIWHLMEHEPPNFKCPLCSRLCADSSILLRHIRLDHRGRDKEDAVLRNARHKRNRLTVSAQESPGVRPNNPKRHHRQLLDNTRTSQHQAASSSSKPLYLPPHMDESRSIDPRVRSNQKVEFRVVNPPWSNRNSPFVAAPNALAKAKHDDDTTTIKVPEDLTSQFTSYWIQIRDWVSYPGRQVTGYSSEKKLMMYHFDIRGVEYRMEYPFTDIRFISFYEASRTREEAMGFITISLLRAPRLFRTAKLHAFPPVHDSVTIHEIFKSMTHYIYGNLETLGSQCEALTSLQCFVDRHTLHTVDSERDISIVKGDEVFTDSGYSSSHPNIWSGRTNRDVTLTRHGSNQETSSDGQNEEDMRTQYSANDSIITHVAQESVARVCDDIYESLRHAINLNGYKELGDRLIELLKAFAIKLGMDQKDSQGLRIMHFIHKHHSEIMLQLNTRFNHEENDQPEPHRDDSHSMSVLEKMRMWDSKSALDNHITRPCTAESTNATSWAVDGDEDDIESDEEVESLESPFYAHAILESTAYQWFLAALEKQSSIYWGSSPPDMMINVVRETIIRKLPTGTISQKRLPHSFKVTFRLLWEPIQERMNQDRNSDSANLLSRSLSDTMIVTRSSDDEVQVCTVGQYLQHTWLEGAPDILDPIQRLLDLKNDHQPQKITGSRELEGQVLLDGQHLVVIVSGPAFFIAQCGEQLAWLGSALQPRDRELDLYKPSIEETSDLEFLITASQESLTDNPISQSLLARPLQLLYSCLNPSSISSGYPTARRPKAFPGLEVSWYTLLTMAQQPRFEPVSNLNGRRLLHGSLTKLELIKVNENVMLWHVVRNTSPGCDCSEVSFKQRNHSKIESITFEDLALCRHIIDVCERDKAAAAQVSISDKGESVAHVSTSKTNYEHVSPSQDPEELPSEPLDNRNIVESEPSVDSDMLSISSSSQDSRISPSVDEKLDSLVKVVCDRLLADFPPWRDSSPGYSPTDGESGGNNTATFSDSTTAHPSSSKSPTAISYLQRKRLFSQRDDQGNDEDGFQKPPHRNLRQSSSTLQSNFACPFWKSDPVKYRKCFSLTLSTASRVKQHLFRNHVPRFYCQRCLVTFEEQLAYDLHIQSPPGHVCTRNSSARLDGISREQHLQLCRKNTRLKESSEVDKWYIIWDIAFPDRSRPTSPYLDMQLTEDCASLKEHFLSNGPDILRQEIVSDLALLMSDSTEKMMTEVLGRAIQAGINNIVDSWTWRQQRTQNGNSTDRTQTRAHSNDSELRTTRSANVPSSNHDSGIFLAKDTSNSSSSQQSQPTEWYFSTQPITSRDQDLPSLVPRNYTTGRLSEMQPMVASDGLGPFIAPGESIGSPALGDLESSHLVNWTGLESFSLIDPQRWLDDLKPPETANPESNNQRQEEDDIQ